MTEGARITVTGTGRASRPAEIARTTFVVEATRPTAAEARGVAAGVAAEVITAIRAAGVPSADLSTAGLDVQPGWEQDGDRMVRTGFTVTNRIGVTVRDLEVLGRVLDAGLDAGATGLEGVSFDLADPAAASEEARRAAVADAKWRAETIASASGARLRRLVAIAEGGADVPSPFPKARMMAMAADAAPTPVMPGAIDVTVGVTAEWELLGPDKP
jgi:uncharacterized protein